MIGQILEYNNPTIGKIGINQELNLENFELLNGIRDENVGIFNSITYNLENNEEEIFPNGPRGILHQDVEYLLLKYGDRNFYTNTKLPGSLFVEFSPSELNIDDVIYFKKFNILRSGIHDHEFKPYLSKYIQTISILENNLNFDTYIKTNKLESKKYFSIFPDVQPINIKPGKFDKQLIEALKNPEKNIDLLREKLELNENTGFYSRDGVAYICLHEFMLYEGKSLKEVVENCADSNFECKFCQSPLTYNTESPSILFDSTQYKLIFMFVATLNLASYEDAIEQVLINGISDSIDKLDIPSDKFVPMSEAFTATYLYKLYTHLHKQIKLVNVPVFLGYIETVWSKNGWDSEIVKNLVDNDERFIRFQHCVDLIITLKEAEKVEDKYPIIDIIMENFNKSNPIQQMFVKDKSQFSKFVDLIFLNTNNYTSLDELNEIMKKSSTEFIKKITNVYSQSSNSIQSYFQLWWKYICPINITHEFVKNECKYCKINENNYHEIYEKYKDKIEKIIIPDSSQSIKLSDKTRVEIIKKIQNEKSTIPSFIGERLTADIYVEKIRKKLEELIGIGRISELADSKEMNYKMLNYLLNNTDINGSRLKMEIESVATTDIPNIGKLVLKF